jgi:hypothetical protein
LLLRAIVCSSINSSSLNLKGRRLAIAMIYRKYTNLI